MSRPWDPASTTSTFKKSRSLSHERPETIETGYASLSERSASRHSSEMKARSGLATMGASALERVRQSGCDLGGRAVHWRVGLDALAIGIPRRAVVLGGVEAVHLHPRVWLFSAATCARRRLPRNPSRRKTPLAAKPLSLSGSLAHRRVEREAGGARRVAAPSGKEEGQPGAECRAARVALLLWR
eukprot:scaffold86286_cov36-Tisochrysis_lutea.AAC.1